MGESSYSKIKVAVIGAGNVATHLARRLSSATDVLQIYSHRLENAVALANEIGVKNCTDDLCKVTPDADIYIISVKDDKIAEVVDLLSRINDSAVWVHTSGSTNRDIFAGKMPHNGVLYPLQTFSKSIAVDVSEVPFFIEASDNSTLELVRRVALMLSEKVYDAGSEVRKQLHLAAVFACNFSNNLWRISDEILHKSNLSIDVLKPLLKVSVEKLQHLSPEEAQTGPAARGDVHIIEKHLEMLSGENREIYRILSDSILNHYHKNERN